MSHANAIAEELADLFSGDDRTVDLTRAALTVARLEYPTLEIDDSLGRLQTFADDVAPALEADRSPKVVIRRMNNYLFEHEGFSGNTEDYYDPRNSFLNDVIERKKGKRHNPFGDGRAGQRIADVLLRYDPRTVNPA